MKIILLLFIYLLFFVFLFLTADYMDQMCGKVMELTKLQSAGILTLTRLWRYKHNMDCTITITAPPHNRVLIRIIKVDIDEDKYRCNDWVQIYDGNKLKSFPTGDDEEMWVFSGLCVYVCVGVVGLPLLTVDEKMSSSFFVSFFIFFFPFFKLE